MVGRWLEADARLKCPKLDVGTLDARRSDLQLERSMLPTGFHYLAHPQQSTVKFMLDAYDQIRRHKLDIGAPVARRICYPLSGCPGSFIGFIWTVLAQVLCLPCLLYEYVSSVPHRNPVSTTWSRRSDAC
jgi:hypothetical protein